MIHFVLPPHNEMIRSRLKDLIPKVDVVLGNLEDAIPSTRGRGHGKASIAMANANDFGPTGLWTRINALNSPWGLDDILEIVPDAGRQSRRDHAAQGGGAVGHPY
jgi:malyl-CoA/(S)-citramalyl-CoA lyase